MWRAELEGGGEIGKRKLASSPAWKLYLHVHDPTTLTQTRCLSTPPNLQAPGMMVFRQTSHHHPVDVHAGAADGVWDGVV